MSKVQLHSKFSSGHVESSFDNFAGKLSSNCGQFSALGLKLMKKELQNCFFSRQASPGHLESSCDNPPDNRQRTGLRNCPVFEKDRTKKTFQKNKVFPQFFPLDTYISDLTKLLRMFHQTADFTPLNAWKWLKLKLYKKNSDPKSSTGKVKSSFDNLLFTFANSFDSFPSRSTKGSTNRAIVWKTYFFL